MKISITIPKTKLNLLKRWDGSGSGSWSEGSNKNFTSTNLPIEQSFSLTPNEIKTDEPRLILNSLATKNKDRLIIGHLNINFIVSIVKDKLDIIMVSKTKVDKSFPESQFIILKPFQKRSKF